MSIAMTLATFSVSEYFKYKVNISCPYVIYTYGINMYYINVLRYLCWRKEKLYSASGGMLTMHIKSKVVWGMNSDTIRLCECDVRMVKNSFIHGYTACSAQRESVRQANGQTYSTHITTHTHRIYIVTSIFRYLIRRESGGRAQSPDRFDSSIY